MEQVLCGQPFHPWTPAGSWLARSRCQSCQLNVELRDACKADHGFTSESPIIIQLHQLLSTFDRQQQRQFLMFVTGSPNLPVGGLAKFRSFLRPLSYVSQDLSPSSPRLTVVCKSVSSGADPDRELPSVMTCQNYLKLPSYSSPAVLQSKLELAITEGQGSFHLS
jgi:E3 ubiquitin-protein ligase TRIP12